MSVDPTGLDFGSGGFGCDVFWDESGGDCDCISELWDIVVPTYAGLLLNPCAGRFGEANGWLLVARWPETVCEREFDACKWDAVVMPWLIPNFDFDVMLWLNADIPPGLWEKPWVTAWLLYCCPEISPYELLTPVSIKFVFDIVVGYAGLVRDMGRLEWDIVVSSKPARLTISLNVSEAIPLVFVLPRRRR